MSARETSREDQILQLEVPAVRALFEGQADAWIVGLASDEKPPRGLAGQLDWHFGGWVSECLRKGVFKGAPGECAYLPYVHQGRTLHLLFAGMGPSQSRKERSLPAQTLQSLQDNLRALGRAKWGISISDLGEKASGPILQALTQDQGRHSRQTRHSMESRLWISP